MVQGVEVMELHFIVVGVRAKGGRLSWCAGPEEVQETLAEYRGEGFECGILEVRGSGEGWQNAMRMVALASVKGKR